MSTTTYKGARYITKFADPIEWSSTRAYEAIESVQYNGFTYLSKQPVPIGVQIDNTDYWLLWADPNAQMEQLRQLVDSYVDDVEANNRRLSNSFVFVDDYGAVGNGTVDDYEAINDAIQDAIENDYRPVIIFTNGKNYLISDTIEIDSNYVTLIGNGCTISSNKSAFIVSAGSHDISFEGFNFDITFNVGSEDETNYGIAIVGESTTARFESYNITIQNCNFNGGVFNLAITNTLNVKIINCKFKNSIFKPSDGAGGYGILLQSCVDVDIENCTFEYGKYGRHSIYVSVMQTKTANINCQNVFINNCIIDSNKLEVIGSAYYSSNTCGIVVRATENLKINNIIHYYGCGTITLNNVDGDIDNAIIENCKLINPRYLTAAASPYEIRAFIQTIGTNDNKNEVIIRNNEVISDETVPNMPITDASFGVGNITLENTFIRYRMNISNVKSFFANNIHAVSSPFYFINTSEIECYIDNVISDNSISPFNKANDAVVKCRYFASKFFSCSLVSTTGTGSIRNQPNVHVPIGTNVGSDGKIVFTFTNMDDKPLNVIGTSSSNAKAMYRNPSQESDNTIVVYWNNFTEIMTTGTAAAYEFITRK